MRQIILNVTNIDYNLPQESNDQEYAEYEELLHEMDKLMLLVELENTQTTYYTE